MAMGIIIVVVIVAAVIIGYVAMNPNALASLRSISPIDMTKPAIVKSYLDCESIINGTYENSRDDRIFSRCDMDNDGIYDDARFTFALPSSMDDFYRLEVKSSVYEYSDGSYELGLYDSVGEKRYKLDLWEFPA